MTTFIWLILGKMNIIYKWYTYYIEFVKFYSHLKLRKYKHVLKQSHNFINCAKNLVNALVYLCT